MKVFIISFLLLIVLATIPKANSQSYTLPLWPEGQVPNYRDIGETEVRDTTDVVRIRNVQKPDIAVFLPTKKNANGQAVVICPGGGYWILAYDWEGSDIAKWLNSNGIAAIVLKYRLPSSPTNIIPHKTPLLDAQRAMRLVRHNAAAWNIDPEQVGIMGFSAGGHLASTLSTHYDQGNQNSTDPIEKHSCRPDFSILMYPVISSDTTIWHQGSFKALLGDNPSQELLDFYSNEKQITEDTPRTILIHSADDKAVPVQNSIRYFEALLAHNVPAEMHIYPFGGHGYSLALDKGYLASWTDRVIDWMRSLEKEK